MTTETFLQAAFAFVLFVLSAALLIMAGLFIGPYIAP